MCILFKFFGIMKELEILLVEEFICVCNSCFRR